MKVRLVREAIGYYIHEGSGYWSQLQELPLFVKNLNIGDRNTLKTLEEVREATVLYWSSKNLDEKGKLKTIFYPDCKDKNVKGMKRNK